MHLRAATGQDVQRVCDAIDIPYYSVNFAREYMEQRVHVLPRRVQARPHAQSGRAVQSRDQVRHAFLRFRARNWARTSSPPATYAGRGASADGEYTAAARSADENKDQTYFLYHARPARRSRTPCFPWAGMTKPEMRAHRRAKRGCPCQREEGFHRRMLHRRAQFQEVSDAVPARAAGRHASRRTARWWAGTTG